MKKIFFLVLFLMASSNSKAFADDPLFFKLFKEIDHCNWMQIPMNEESTVVIERDTILRNTLPVRFDMKNEVLEIGSEFSFSVEIDFLSGTVIQRKPLGTHFTTGVSITQDTQVKVFKPGRSEFIIEKESEEFETFSSILHKAHEMISDFKGSNRIYADDIENDSQWNALVCSEGILNKLVNLESFN